MNAFQILELLENTSSTSEKQKILTANKDNIELAALLDAALNFKRKFFVKKFTISEATPLHNRDTFNIFLNLLNKLETREITGGQAIAAVEDFFFLCSDIERKWYSRVLRKNLRAGFGLTEANKAGFDIPDFDVMLAKDGKDCKNLEKIVKEGVYISPKLDGYRCIAVCSYGEVQLYSRNGTIYENFPSIIEALEAICQDSAFVLDGEIMSNDFNKMQQSAFASKRGTTVGDVAFHVFGWIGIDEWNSDIFKMPTKLRLDNMFLTIANADPQKIKGVQQRLVSKIEDVIKAEKDYMAQGFEGAMLLPNIPYYRGRKSNKLMKFKTMHSMECKIIGIYEGEGKNSGRMGGLKLIQENGLPCDVGSGFTDDERDQIWKDPSSVVGRILEIQYQELTPDGVMRFPVALRYRDDKSI